MTAYNYTAKFITTGGRLDVKANYDQIEKDIYAVFTDEKGNWSRTFLDLEGFRSYIKNLNILNQLSISEYIK